MSNASDEQPPHSKRSPDPEAQLRRRMLRSGEIVGKYVIGEMLARGGYGCVYRARHADTGKAAAVKVLHDALATQAKIVGRFTREVQVVQMLRHPNIVDILDVGALPDGQPYYVMEYVAGRTIAALLDAEGRFSPEETFAVLKPVCSALSAAHAAGVVHRDVKANNIMVGNDEPRAVKLLDFGIAKLLSPEPGASGLTTVGRPIGTLAIMAPEQLLGEEVDLRVDIYALGILLYRMLTGRVPFPARTAHELVHQHLEEPPPRPSERAPIPPAIDAVVLRCLEKRRERRFDSVAELLSALRDAVTGPNATRDSAPPILTSGFAVHVKLRLRGGETDWEDTLDDVGLVLDTVEDHLRTEKFVIVASTGTDILGVRLLASGSPAERAEILGIAAELRRLLDDRPGAHPNLHVNVVAHAGSVLVRDLDEPEVLGGELVRADEWTLHEDVDALCATTAVVAGVEGLDTTPGPGSLVTVRDGRDALR